MFAAAERGHRLDKAGFERRLQELRRVLLAAQYRLLRDPRFALVILAHGEPSAGRTEFVNHLTTWIDPRHVAVHAVDPDGVTAAGRPPMWRFWTLLPPRGRITVLLDSWYTEPLLDRLCRRIGRRAFEERLAAINAFERMLDADHHHLLKLWFHVPVRDLKRRVDALRRDETTAWRVTPEEREFVRAFRKRSDEVEKALAATSTPQAPWRVIDGHDKHWAQWQAGQALRTLLASRLSRGPERPPPRPAPVRRPPATPNALSALDLTATLDEARYNRELARLQARLAEAIRRKPFRRRSLVAVFEGADAAGKGGAVRHVAEAIDARFLTIVPIAAPSDEERARPYLWRFWRHLPVHGHVTIFDRSWYGRVLVERVEGFCAPATWRRAYAEINAFEDELVAAGTIVAKFYLTVSPAEQLRRFRERESTPWKRFKIGPEDWRNRAKRHAYDHAVLDMLAETDTPAAPWTLIEGDDKRFARVKVMRRLVEAVETAL
ncbi:MAG: polyphosphate:AMP phosphotransferase [Alphaproteobacteria bacterium]|nr:polyphosphate:AMP phosphotransferase [Alphaproteobacteria bacterium]